MRDAEIGNLHRTVGEDDDVRGLDVAVDHAKLVRIAERGQDLRQDADGVRRGEALVRLEVFLELAALDKLHRDVPDAGVFAEVVDGHDVGMRQPPGCLRFAAKARSWSARMVLSATTRSIFGSKPS